MSAPAVDEYAEQAVLGALLLYGEPSHVRTLVKRGLKAEHFYFDRYRRVFRAAVSLADEDEKVDVITVVAELERQGVSVNSHDIEYLAGCVPAAGNIGSYAKRVQELATWRGRAKVLHKLLAETERRHEDGFVEHLSRLQRSVMKKEPRKEPEAPVEAARNVSRTVQIDFQTGEVVRDETHALDCQNCQKLQDQLKGRESDVKKWTKKYHDLRRDREADAQKEALWLVAQALFDMWRRVTGHKRSKFTLDRYEAILPFLRDKDYGPAMCERAIAGVGFDVKVSRKPRLNGTYERYDQWEWIFKTADRFEEYANRAPRDWKPTLSAPVPDERPKLVAVKGEAG